SLSTPSTSFSSITAPPPTHTYTLSLHDALPIWPLHRPAAGNPWSSSPHLLCTLTYVGSADDRIPLLYPYSSDASVRLECTASCRSEEHTSELQSRENLVCRLLLEKKKKTLIHQL